MVKTITVKLIHRDGSDEKIDVVSEYLMNAGVIKRSNRHYVYQQSGSRFFTTPVFVEVELLDLD